MSGILQGTPVRPSHPQFIPSRAYARLLAELPRFDDTPVETTYLVNWPRRTGKTTLVTSLVSALDQDASTHLTRLIVPFYDKAG